MKHSDFNKYFIKDLKLPVAVEVEPYFSHLMTLLDPYYKTISKYKIFEESFNEFGKEMFFDNNRKIVDSTIQYIKNSKDYEFFNNIDMNQFKKEFQIQGQNLYKSHNANKEFISIDLVKANFQSMHYVCPDIFDGHTDYNSFVKSRGFNEFMLISKQIRQVIFGNTNPQRQQKVQLFMMNKIASQIVDSGVNLSSIYSLSSDELVFEKNDVSVDLTKSVISDLGFQVRVESFVLERPFDKPYFVKRMNDGSVDFKMVPTNFMAEFIKRFEGRELEDLDFYFYDENKRLSRYVKPFIE